MSQHDKRHYSLFPKTLEHCIESLTRPVLKTQGLAGTQILTQWENIMGPRLSRCCYPEKLSFPRGKKSAGTLTISCQNGFAPELQHMHPIILERLASYFGYQAVTRIVISHSWVAPQTMAPITPRKTRPLMLSADLTDGIIDVELKEALASFAAALSQPT